MKRYNSTPNRLSYQTSNYIPPSKRYKKRFPFFFISMAIVISIALLLLYKTCNYSKPQHQMQNNTNYRETQPDNTKKPQKTHVQKNSVSLDNPPPLDSQAPETDLLIIKD